MLVVLAAEGLHWCLPCLCGGCLVGRGAHHHPPPSYFSFNYCCLLILVLFVTNLFILMCEWLSIPSTGPAEMGESGGRGCSGEASSSPLISPLPSPVSSLPLPGLFIPLGSSPGLAPTWSQMGFPPHLPAGWWSPARSLLPSVQSSLLRPTAVACPPYLPQTPRPAGSPCAWPVSQGSPLLGACQPPLWQVLGGAHKAGLR